MATGSLPSLREWLQQIELSQYYDLLISVGFDTVEQLQAFGLDDNFLNDIGISKYGHRKRILEFLPVAVNVCTPKADTPKNSHEEENIYENVEYSPAQKSNNESEDIYVNYTPSSSSEENMSPNSSESGSGVEVRKKPVPRPRLSKMSKEQKEELLKQNEQPMQTLQDIPQSPTPVASPRHCPTVHISGVTVSESTSDFDPFAVRKSLMREEMSGKYSDELMNMLNANSYSEKPPERPTGFLDNFGAEHINNRSSDTYDAIWTDSPGSAQNSNESHVRKASDMSPYTPPFLPKPCSADTFDFDKNEHEKQKFIKEPVASAPVEINQGKTTNSSQKHIYVNEQNAYEPIDISQGKKTSRTQKPIYVNEQSPNTESPPLPSFPPPNLPPGEVLPPVPPRPTANSNDSMKPQVTAGEHEQEEIYSRKYVEKGFFSSSKFKTLNSSSGPDPFNGEDPFKDDAFQQECQYFNQPGADSIFEPGVTTVEPAFDPFGIYEFQKGWDSNDPLDQVPPAPEWHETVQVPKAAVPARASNSVYSFAAPVQQDSSNSEVSEGDSTEPSSTEENSMQSTVSPTINIIPASQSVRKKKEKSGYLDKQGGVNANKGWKRRWVVFDGKSLRYYPNHKSQVSKRIIPLACMKRVIICPTSKERNSDKYKFNLVTSKRTFKFAAKTCDDCSLWANTLMEAIITYRAKTPEGSEPEGGDMCNPDKMGHVKFERKKDQYFVAIKNGKLAYYDSHEDYKIASPLNEIDMKLASVKEVDKNRLQLSTHYVHFILMFTEKQDCVFWKMAIEDAIADALGDNTVLDCVRENPSNHLCADCNAKDPQWASINIGIVLCKNCAGIHRDFDPRVSRVKSLRMDTTIWTPSLIGLMKAIGNENSRHFWEKDLQAIHKINPDSSPIQRKAFIQEKYIKKQWIDRHPLVAELNEELLRTVVTDDILQTMRIVFSGANILYVQSDTGKTAFDLAKDAGQRLQTEFLYHNGGDRSSRVSANIDEALALRLRAEITMEGHLLKTGPKNRNAFMDRYCVIEHGCLRYFVNEKSSTARDSIDNESMLCVQAVSNIERSVLNLRVRQLSVRRSIKPDPIKRYPNAFELSTTKSDNRIYLFAASNADEKMAWMRTLSKLFCPVHFIKEMHDKDFSLAGNFYVKAGVAAEWQKTWILVDKKVVRYLNEEQQLHDIDLRKVSNIHYVEHVAGQPCSSAIEIGKCFTLDIPGKSLYFQADLKRDTERLHDAFANSMKGGGPTLEDQQLTSENIPVVVHKCIEFIEEHGMDEEGIYRIAAVNSKVQDLLTKFLADAHSLTLRRSTYQVHEVANCLKRFFRQLKDPLFTKVVYKDWIKCAAMKDEESKLAYYQFYLNQLPQVNKCTVRKLVLHFASLSTHSDATKMTIQNLAVAVGPSLMRGGQEAIQQEWIPLENAVLIDLINHHHVLFEKEVQKNEHSERLLEDYHYKLKLAEQQHQQHRDSFMNPNNIADMKVTIYNQHRTNPSVDHTALKGGTVADAVEDVKKKFKLSPHGQWVLYEVVQSDVFERPLHPSECLLDVVMSWSMWEEEYSKNIHLVVKSAEQMLKLNQVYNPDHSLFAEFKYKEKSGKFKKYSFGFNQSKLSLFKDSGYNTQPSKSWKVEDMYIFFGADPKKTPQRHAFSFYMKGEKMGDMKTICCTTENELINWMAAMLKAKHPDGYLTS